jgi:hypothetical protein
MMMMSMSKQAWKERGAGGRGKKNKHSMLPAPLFDAKPPHWHKQKKKTLCQIFFCQCKAAMPKTLKNNKSAEERTLERIAAQRLHRNSRVRCWCTRKGGRPDRPQQLLPACLPACQPAHGNPPRHGCTGPTPVVTCNHSSQSAFFSGYIK